MRKMITAISLLMSICGLILLGTAAGERLALMSEPECVDGVFVHPETGYIMADLQVCGKHLEVRIKEDRIYILPLDEGVWR